MFFKFLPLLFSLLLTAQTSVAETVEADDGPLALVKGTADKVLAEVLAKRETLDQDPSGIFTLVGEYVIPHFDFEYMTRTAAGKYWRRAKDSQKISLVREFRELLIRTYGTALLHYSGQAIEYLPMRESSRENQVMVMTRVANHDGPSIPINYRLRFKDDRWMVLDVVIDGVSLVSNYRSSFAAQIRRGGIDGLIRELASHNREK